MTWEVSREFSFEAAHRLPNAPHGHKARRLHGHSFKVELSVSGDLKEPEGWVYDFVDLAAAWKPLYEELDHRYLNEIPGLENPTSELIARWISKRIVPQVPGLRSVRVAESCMSGCTLSATL